MASLQLAHAVISLLLLGIAIYEHTTAAALSLPISPASTISTIILPILSFLNTVYFTTTRARPSQHPSNRTSQQQHQLLLPAAFQILQTIITTVLATTFVSDIIPSATRQCLLSTRWQRLWTGHDAAAIRRIQDTFDCCGFNSVRDRAWPFPNRNNPQPGCAAQFGRTAACAGPWSRALQTVGGVEFGVVAAVGMLQLLSILLLKYGSARGRRSGSAPGWMRSVMKRLTGGDDEYSERGNLNRPLLEDGRGPDGNRDAVRTNRINGVEDETSSRQGHGSNGYRDTHTGSTGARVEPSHLESSPWAGEEDSEA